MASASLYRAHFRNSDGDPINANGDVVRLSDGDHVGDLTVIIGGPTWRPATIRGDAVDTTDMIGVSVAESVQPRSGDTLVVGTVKYVVRGPAQWSHDSVLTGTPRRWTWFTIQARSN